MPIPNYQSCMLPLLEFYSDNKEHSAHEACAQLAKKFQLTGAERQTLLPSGQQTVFENRVGWARTYLKKSGLIDAPKRGVNKITSRGLEVLQKNPTSIDVRFLEQFQEFKEFRDLRRNDGETEPENGDDTPEELLERAHQTLQSSILTDLLQRLKACSPSFFEKIVVEVILKMGYGGSRQDAGKAIGQTGDGGIDGIIKQDKLGLDAIYIQAKKWESVVGRPEIQKFVGALTGQRARKGVFITTSDFSSGAKDYASQIDTKVILVDGKMLARLMLEHNVGVSLVSTYAVKKIDSDYFSEE